MAFQNLAVAFMAEMFCARFAAKSRRFVRPAALPNCINCALSGPQPLEQAASGSVNGDNAAQPAADTVAGVDGSASAHAIQVCTT